MPNVRISLSSVGYPKDQVPNSVLVLQTLHHAGYTISLLNGKRYKDKRDILDWFYDRGIHVHFLNVSKPDIEVNNTFMRIKGEKYDFDPSKGWSILDRKLLEKNIYFNTTRNYEPSYKEDTYFMVVNYGEKDQVIYSKPRSLKSCKSTCKILNFKKEVNTIHIINASTLEMVECYNIGTGEFEKLDSDIYFNLFV